MMPGVMVCVLKQSGVVMLANLKSVRIEVIPAHSHSINVFTHMKLCL